MSEPSTASQQRLFDYLQAALKLAQAVEADVANGKKLSSATVVQLSKFMLAAKRFEKGLELMDAVMADLNKDIN